MGNNMDQETIFLVVLGLFVLASLYATYLMWKIDSELSLEKAKKEKELNKLHDQLVVRFDKSKTSIGDRGGE